VLLAFLFLGWGCVPANQGANGTSRSSAQQPSAEAGFALPQQKAPPNDIQSIQLHRKGDPGLPPIIELGSGQKLELSFDYLGQQSRQFLVEVSHRTQQWTKSGIGPSTYLDSFFQTYIQESKASFTNRPSYQHVEYEFPNDQLRPVVSGNYLLEIYSYENGNLLFSMPFFITENEGSIKTRVESLFAQRSDGRPLAQPFSTYRYPDFVEYPQFDLSISFAANQFWGRMKEAGFLDTISPGELNGHLQRDQAFLGNYEFKLLDLRSFDVNAKQILDYQPSLSPPKVTLRRDIQKLDTNPRLVGLASLGLPIDNRSSQYAEVAFSLDAEASIPPSSDIYVVGHFNNWMINELNKLSYNDNSGLWTGRALVKQGEYAYKYVLVTNGTIDDLSLDQGFLSPQQEYLTFIYFKDPKRNYDRILKVDRIIKQ
jgi:hypothetical protein